MQETSATLPVTTVEELTLLLMLNGSRRIPHLEEEIFADSELTVLYLQHMTLYRFTHHSIYELTDAYKLVYANDWSDPEILCWAIYFYAGVVMHAPWPAAEHIFDSTNIWKWGLNYRKKYFEEHYSGTQ